MADILYRPLSERARIALRGPDRKRFLHGMVTNDINGLRPGGGCHAAMLTVKGKMLADMTVYDCAASPGPDHAGDDELLLEMEGAVREKIAAALDRHLIMDDVTVHDRSDELDELGVYASDAAALAQALGAALGVTVDATLPAYHHTLIATSEGSLRLCAARALGIPGYHLFGPAALLAALRERLGPDARLLSDAEAEVLRVEAGVPRYGLDMDEERLPIEANLDHAVSYQKGCYLGQEVIARLSARGHVNRRLLGLRLHLPAGAPLPDRGATLAHESKDNAGTVQSAVRSPRLGPIALGYVHRSVWEPGTRLHLQGGGEAVVTALPFGDA